jgi:DNA-binding GntR family transcriptional regulator
MAAIERAPLRDQVYEHLLKRILTGDCRPGTRVKDTDLSGALGVSRTPVRETLLRLTHEGLLDNPPGRGFTVTRLDMTEIREAYPILWTLEALALSLAAPLPREVLDRLDNLNARLSRIAAEPMRRIEIDAQWHTTLVSSCGNNRLLETIAQLRNVVRRYEFAYMEHIGRVTESVGDHDEIVAGLRRGEQAQAGTLLAGHWRRSLDALAAVVGS